VTPRVTVVVTVFNRARWLGASLESVLAQSYGDIAVLVVDDVSTDGSLEVAGQYAKWDARVRVVRNPRNLGDFGNRNQAAALVETEFFKFHDSDDMLYPHALQAMVPPLIAEPVAGMAASGHGEWAGGPCPLLLTPAQCYEREYLGGGLFMLGPAGLLFRTAAFRSVGGFDEVGPQSDLAFWLKACRTLSVLLVPNDLYWYRVHQGQENQSVAAHASRGRSARREWDALAHPDCPLSVPAREQARRHQAFNTARGAWRLGRAGRWRDAAAFLRDAGLSAGEWLRYLRRPQRVHGAGTPSGSFETFEHARWGLTPPDRRR
jgi:glycosyltransferase involved in cell wall biosynthesis